MVTSIQNKASEAISYVFSTHALRDFHGRVMKTLDPLTPVNQLKQLVLKIIVLVAAVFIYPILTATALISLALGSGATKKEVKTEELVLEEVKKEEVEEYAIEEPEFEEKKETGLISSVPASKLELPKIVLKSTSFESDSDFDKIAKSVEPAFLKGRKVTVLTKTTTSEELKKASKSVEDVFPFTKTSSSSGSGLPKKTETMKHSDFEYFDFEDTESHGYVPVFSEEKKVPVSKSSLRDSDFQLTEGLSKEHYQEMIRATKANWLDDYNAELKRLKEGGIYTDDVEKKLTDAIKEIDLEKTPEALLQAKVLFARALEIKGIYEDHYYVFIQAQATPWMIVTHLIKELAKRDMPEKDMKLFKYPRIPNSLRFSEEAMIKSLKSGTKDDDIRDAFLSVDGYWYNNERKESALYFLLANSNIFTSYEEILSKVVEHYLPPELHELAPSIVTELSNLAQEYEKKASSGNLSVICIPKNLVGMLGDKIAFRSHPYGKKCECHPAKENEQILFQLQHDLLEKATQCDPKYNPIPQFRLLADEITPDNIHSFLLTPFAKGLRKEIKNKVISIAQNMTEMAYQAVVEKSRLASKTGGK